MKCKDLFADSDVVFVPVEKNLQRQESKITTYANYHGFKIQMELGLWVNPADQSCERVLQLTFAGYSDNPRYPSRSKLKPETIMKREEKRERIQNYIKKGMTIMEMARKEKCSKQAISQFIKYHNVKYKIDI